MSAVFDTNFSSAPDVTSSIAQRVALRDGDVVAITVTAMRHLPTSVRSDGNAPLQLRNDGFREEHPGLADPSQSRNSRVVRVVADMS